MELEHKYCRIGGDVSLGADGAISGYASLFDRPDNSGDTVRAGAYGACLARLAKGGGRVRMLWQHDPAQPIGLWEEVREDQRGLWVRGRFLSEVSRGREAQALVAAGAIDGLSIGYRTLRATKGARGRELTELDLWEVSLVTFPMLDGARVSAKTAPVPGDAGAAPAVAADLAALFRDAARHLRAG